MGTKWLEITVYTTDAGIDDVSAALTGAGIASLSIEESHEVAFQFIKESALYWDFADEDKIGVDEPCVKAYVADLPENKPQIEAVKDAIRRLRTMSFDHDLGSLAIHIQSVDEEDWSNNWKQYYKPIEIGQKLLILPAWEPAPETDRAILKLNPGMAFGTGSHQTTRMCLELLEKTVQPGQQMLDLGCGSGILSIASVLLGADHALAVDIDPIALDIAYENASMNMLDRDRFEVLIGDVLTDTELQKKIAGTYDVIAANIVADVIIALAPIARPLLKADGRFIVSGIIDERTEDVTAGLTRAGFSILEHKSSDGWNAFLCQ